MLPPAIMWIDPGKMTGISTYTIAGQQAGYQFQAGEYPFQEACARIHDWCQGWGGSLLVGWERFDINSETHKKTREGTNDAMHVIGVCRYAAARHGCQAAQPAQQHTPDPIEREQLKALGWWVPGEDDTQSASCHMLRYLIRTQELTPVQRDILYPR